MSFLILSVLFCVFLTVSCFFVLRFERDPEKDRKSFVIQNMGQNGGTHSNCEHSPIDDKEGAEDRVSRGRFPALLYQIYVNPKQGFQRFFGTIWILKMLSILFVFFVTWGIYGLTGNPKMRSSLFQELMNRDPKTLDTHERLVYLQTLFFRRPHDGKVADALAISYLEASYFQDAINTYLDALRLNGESAPRLVGYGLALVGYESGIITQEAKNAFQKAADLAPRDFYPRLFLAGALLQEGKSAQAIQLLQNFLSVVPKDTIGRSRVEDMIIRLRSIGD